MFFAAIGSGLLSSWLVGQQAIAAFLVVIWLVRVWCLQVRWVWWTTVVLVSLMGSWFLWQNQRFQRFQAATPHNQTVMVTVQPDDINVNGGQYRLIATLPNRDRLLVYGRLTTPTEKRALQAVTQRTSWQLQGSWSPIPPPTNPGQFDAPAYYRSQGIYQQLTVQRASSPRLALRSGLAGMNDAVHRWRQQFRLACDRLPATLRLYATSLLIGMRPATFTPVMTSERQLGLLHLFSLSGMHVILLLSGLRWLLTWLRVTATTSDALLLGLLPVYLILGGGSDSLQRAVITAGLPIVCQLLTRQATNALAGWSLALLLGLLINPLVLLQLGGQLSYGLALLLILGQRQSVWHRAWNIQLVSLPVLLMATAQWHVLTVIVNLLVAPIFSWVLLPLTILGASGGFVWPILASWCDGGLAVFQHGLDVVGHWPGLLTLGQPPAYLGWLLGLLTLAAIRQPAKRWWWRLSLTYALVVASIHWPLHGAVEFIDIGQGDSILIRQPFNRTVSLIDTGGRLNFPQPAWQRPDTPPTPRVANVTVNYLHRLGLTKLDTVYLSHKDVDHIGDLGELLRRVNVKRIVVPAGMAQLPKFQQLLRPAKQRPQVIEAVAGMTFEDGLTAVHPFQPGRAENEDSLVLTGRFGQHQFMFTGDLDRAGERAIVARYPQLRVDVLKLGHHGSRTASDPAALQQLGVQRGILSVGRHNRYGHPNADTLATLRQQQILTYSTAQQGMIRYHFGWQTSQWETFLKEGNLYQRTTSPQGH